MRRIVPVVLALVMAMMFARFARAARPSTEEEKLPQVGIGYEPPAEGAQPDPRLGPVSDPTASATNPLYVRVGVLWADVERSAGQFDWTRLDGTIDRYRTSHHDVVLDLWGGNPLYSSDVLRPPGADDPKGTEAWEMFVRQAARHFKDRVRFFQIGRSPDAAAIWGSADSVPSYAYLLKKSAVLVRAEDKDAIIVMGGLGGANTTWLERLYAEGSAPYVDVVSFRPDPRKDIGAQCAALVAMVREKDGSSAIWAESVPAQGTGADMAASLVRTLLVAFDQGVTAMFFALPPAETAGFAGADTLVRVHSALAAGMARVPSADRITFTDAGGAALGGVKVASFYDSDAGLSVTGFWTEGTDPAPSSAIVHVTARRPGPPTLYDPILGKRTDLHFEPEPTGAKGEIPLAPAPQFLVYREPPAGAPTGEGSESLEISAARGITADEVIERYRVFQAAQTALLHNYSSAARIDYHFRLEGTSRTIDVGLGGSYFYDPKGVSEWEIKDYYVGGNKSRWKSFPELPLVQPEKVLTLPLDITFDRSYTYTYDGEDTIEGRACHVLSFVPTVDSGRSLYRGKLWIDKTTWARVRVDAIQTNLEPPIPSSEEKTFYAPVRDTQGEDLWVPSRIEGQQIYSAAGRSFVVLREIHFSDFRFNDPDFAARKQMAEDSDHQMLRDTDKGMRYMVRGESGERVPKDFDTNQFFGLAGAIYDPSLTHPVPLLGVNYFDYNFRNTGLQTNLFFAGALMALNVTDPNVKGTGLDIGGDLFLSALNREDKDFREGEEIEPRGVSTRQQSVAFNLGRKLGEFGRIRATYELAYQAFDVADDTDNAYVIPKDTLVHMTSLTGSFDRAGYEVSGTASYAVRSTYEFWGDPCQLTNPNPRPGFCDGATAAARERRDALAGEDFNPTGTGFMRYKVGATKEFFLPSFQKLGLALNLYSGSDLDRFSRYTFNRLDAHLVGFSGSGIRFDRGGTLGVTYGFNVANLVRFEGRLQHGRVEDTDSDLGVTNHTGIGLSANILGPWKTVWQLEYGYALRSDVKPAEGNQDLLLVILKLF